MPSLSTYQAAAVMLCFSLGRLIAFRPMGDSLLICAAAAVCCDALLTAAYALLSALPMRSGVIKKAAAVPAVIWLGFTLTVLFIDLADLLTYSFPEFYAPAGVIIAAAAAAAYCASMGLPGLGRAACAVVVLTLLTLLLTAVGAVSRFDPERLELAVRAPRTQFFRQLLRQLTRSPEFLLFLLIKSRCRQPRRAVLLRFAGQSVITAGMALLCAGVLGERGLSGIPADTLSSYSKTSVIERFDALMLLVWTLCMLFSAAALMAGIVHLVRPLTDRLRSHTAIASERTAQ